MNYSLMQQMYASRLEVRQPAAGLNDADLQGGCLAWFPFDVEFEFPTQL